MIDDDAPWPGPDIEPPDPIPWCGEEIAIRKRSDGRIEYYGEWDNDTLVKAGFLAEFMSPGYSMTVPTIPAGVLLDVDRPTRVESVEIHNYYKSQGTVQLTLVYYEGLTA